ncbi:MULTISPECIES: hypothetical protein [Mycolicibacterium]|uniref:hypothetical protein n=1 Tax=Mycolicibacterium TaxID=1866885 RepID=UPI0007E9B1DB|nr:hypothetical protein [Mycolicibacterium fortuitum]OBG24107.1 hypothetical protein A5768_22320 [Mycolicibacterium fortuitum]
MAGTKMDEPLDVDFDDIDPDAKPDPKDEPKTEPKSEPKADPKPASGGGDPKPTTPAPDAPAPDAPADTPKPTAGERIGNGLGFPREDLGKIKSEPWEGAKGFFKAQWNVTPQAVENVAAAKAAAKAGRDAVKAEGATAESVAAAKQSARDGVKLAAGELFTKVGAVKMASRAVPVLGSLYSAYAAFNSFKEGRIVAGVLDMIGIIPGPVGWVAMAASWAWKTWGEDNIGKWDAPDGSATYMLPASAADITGVSALDAALREAQGAVFSFQDGPQGTVWDSNAPKALRLDGPGVQKALEGWLGGITALFAEIDKVMQQSGESYFQQQRQKLAPHLSAMSKLKAESRNVMTELKAASDGADEAYKAVTGANVAARGQLADDGELKDQGSAITATTLLEKGAAKIETANDRLGQLFGETPAVVVNTAEGTVAAPVATPAPTKPTPTPTPAAVTPAATPSPQQTTPKKEMPKATDDALQKLLSQLNKTQTPSSNPLGTGGGLGGGNPLGNSGLGGNQGGGTPLSQTKPHTTSEPKKLVEDKPKKREEKEEQKKEEEQKKPLTNNKAEQEKAGVPAAEPKPAVAPAAAPVAAAPTPAQQNAAHAAKAEEKPNTDVDVKGSKTTFPDPKTAKMAQLLASADPTHPKSLADAAAEAGLKPPVPGQDPGQQIPPSDAKPGDVMVAGEKKYMLLGDGKFYDLSEYKVIGADELPKEMGERSGYFRLADANPGQPGPGGQQQGGAVPVSNPQGPQGPISPQNQGGAQHQVPGATGAPTGPVAGNPSPTGMPPAAPGGVQSAGSPGVPKPGAPGTGPGNAGATDTGTGVGGPSTAGGQRLDPGAIR